MVKEVFVFEVSQNNFDQTVVLNSHKIPVIVEFMSAWSEPCVLTSDHFSLLAKEFAEAFIFAKVDIDEQPELKQRYNIRNIPTIMVFQDGNPVRTELGQLSATESRQLLRDFGVYRPSDPIREQAREKHLAGDTHQAILLLTQAIQSEPGNTLVAMDMTQIFIDIGELEQALSLFDKLPESDRQSEMGRSLSGQLSFAKLARDLPPIEQLQATIEQQADDYAARFELAIQLVSQYQYAPAMDQLFYIFENQPDYKDGAAKEMIITISNMLSPTDHALAQSFRTRLSNLVSD